MLRLPRLAAAAVLTAAATMSAGATPAHADAADATCPVATKTVTYAPGVTFAPTLQQVHTSTSYLQCVSLSRPDIISGHSAGDHQEVLSCLDPSKAGHGSRNITWNTGERSTFTYERLVSHMGGNTVTTLTGMITDGVFQGDAAVEVITGPTLDTLKCLAPPGITDRTGTGTLTITSL